MSERRQQQQLEMLETLASIVLRVHLGCMCALHLRLVSNGYINRTPLISMDKHLSELILILHHCHGYPVFTTRVPGGWTEAMHVELHTWAKPTSYLMTCDVRSDT